MSGESLVAAAGLAAAAIMVAALGACAWWTLRSHAESADAAREERVRAVAGLIGRSAEGLIANNELSSLRRMVAEATLAQGFEKCRIVLPAVKDLVVADGRTSGRMIYGELPAKWEDEAKLIAGGGSAMESSLRRADGVLEVRVPLVVPGRGTAVLEVEDAYRLSAAETWPLQAGIGVIAATALGAMWVGYRAMRRRVRALGAIGEALRASTDPDSAEGELIVSDELGADAVAWNRLVADRKLLREHLTGWRVAEKLASRRSRDGDLGSLCDGLWMGLLLVDDQMKVKYANGAATVFLNTSREALTGAELKRVLEEQPVHEAVRGIMEGSVKNRTVVEIRRNTGPGTAGHGGAVAGSIGASVLRITVRPLRKEDSATALIVIEDVTQQRVADEARNSFVAQATHELRTPLTNIRLYLEMLVDGGGAEDPQKRSDGLNTISQEVRRLERIVGDMLSVAEIDAGSMKVNKDDVRVATIFDELASDFREQAAHKEITLKFDLPPKLPVIRGDRDKIVMALHNLVGNAVKYTPAGGEVTVRVGEEKGQLTVEVIDNGIGVRDEERELIFEKFYRAKDRRISNVTGTGLGLAIAREVVRLHGGDISVRSQLDKGSTFTMTLPMAA
ncbi:MAG: sensor histidine kinase [Phycisphaerales bacterium]